MKKYYMKREDIQEQFRVEKQEPIFTVNKLDVSVNNKYVVWLENKILALSIDSVIVPKGTVCDYCGGSGWDSYPNHSTTHAPCPKCQP